MRLRDLILDTFATLKAHKLRTALTMFGIAWGIISIVLMVAAGEGLREGQQKQENNLGRDIMIVFPGRTSLQAGGTRAGRVVRFYRQDLEGVAQDSPDCSHVLPELERDNVPVHSNYNAGSFLVTGSLPVFQELRSLEVAEGRFYDAGDLAQARRVAFVGSDAARQLFSGHPALGENIYLAGIPYRVIGVMRHKEQDSDYDGEDVNKVYVPYTAMREDFPNKPPETLDSLDHLLVTPATVEQDASCKRELLLALGRRDDFDPADKEAVGIWDTVEDAQDFKRMTDGMKYFLGAVGLVTLLLGGLGVMNVMLVAVRERTREIGIRKAIGAPARTILRQFFAESMVVVFFSGGLGFLLSYGMCWLVDLLPMPAYFDGLQPTWSSGILSFLLLGTVAVAAAMYPASRAAAVDPIEALRYEAGG